MLIAYTCGRQKSKEQTYMLITYTCGGQKSNGCAYTLVAYTCGGQKSNGCAYTLVTYTYGGQKSRRHAYTVIAYTCGGQKSNGCAYTLVAYTCGGQKSRRHAFMVIAYTCGGQKSKVRAPELPRIPFYALWGPLTPVWGPNSLKIPQKRPKRPFFRLSCPITQPPGGESKNGVQGLSGLTQRSFLPSFIQIRQRLGQLAHQKPTNGGVPHRQQRVASRPW